MNGAAGVGAGPMLVVALIGLFIAILWILLPFAVFGVKPKLDAIISELRLTRAAIEQNTQPP